MSVTILHNPRCSKSRQTLELLRSKGIEPEIREYLKDPLSLQELQELSSILGEPTNFLRNKEQAYKDLVSKKGEPNNKTLLSWMVENPIIIERPIVINGSKAAIGRPPENILEIL